MQGCEWGVLGGGRDKGRSGVEVFMVVGAKWKFGGSKGEV
jgi:hypothetical protein